ncbi:3-deoxy-8-phosphooctulonate synthase [Candidatus Liberibacter africanus]|uniref:2-dehydro-3-deoxyphosphooctonate aldolase n=1 Tax=Candidatus Liberibacter africanus PTSAPSY TaxID=1277257 RepID=A0A0G3I657_LIBAF|nr:3-deoxy-8-phosphooctulonate synthase [Candidatus Liberibacter africanus]AKK19923.1 2-dehydro-3-deoxyphosphooctonate aldolase [Candidatus Liberibacter africanus PTSAPSY]QTP63767.1 3-deoxy-8-phosphooctulonate synthase [Candidatus Liberibacter africanus]
MTHTNSEIRLGYGTTQVTFCNKKRLVLIAGPCQIESHEHTLMMAEKLHAMCQDLNIQLIYKSSFDKANRSSLTGKRGVGLEKGREIFLDLKKKYNFPILTDVHNEQQCEAIADSVDILQIPALLCRQTDLLIAAARTGRVINVKKGQFLSPWEMRNVLQKLNANGAMKVIFCERGTSFGYNNLITDMRSMPIMASMGVPVVFDASHSVQQPGIHGNCSGGERQFIATLAKAAVATGIAGIFLETHQDPDNAPSDGPNMININDLPELLSQLIAIDKVVKSL